MYRTCAVLLLILWPLCRGFSQTIHGDVQDMDGRKLMGDVRIENIYTSLVTVTGVDGTFNIDASSDQLLEFRKEGYKTARVRIPKGHVPPWFRIIMEKGKPPRESQYLASNTKRTYKEDSIRFRELYKHELDFPKMSAVEMIAHPFSAMSGKNREIWQFQEDYDAFQKEKYIDMTFSPELVTKFTGMTGDSLTTYLRKYRPSYEQLRSMTEYSFYNYIVNTARKYQHPLAPASAK